MRKSKDEHWVLLFTFLFLFFFFSNWQFFLGGMNLSLEPATYRWQLSFGMTKLLFLPGKVSLVHDVSINIPSVVSLAQTEPLWMTNCPASATQCRFTHYSLWWICLFLNQKAAGSGPCFCHPAPGLLQLTSGHPTSAAHLDCSSLSGNWLRPFRRPSHGQMMHPSPLTTLCQAACYILTTRRAQLPSLLSGPYNGWTSPSLISGQHNLYISSVTDGKLICSVCTLASEYQKDEM